MEKLQIYDFYTEYCSPCKLMLPIIDSIISEYSGNENIEIKKINTDIEPELTVKYGIRSVPTILFIKNSEVVDKINGATSKKVILDKIESLL